MAKRQGPGAGLNAPKKKTKKRVRHAPKGSAKKIEFCQERVLAEGADRAVDALRAQRVRARPLVAGRPVRRHPDGGLFLEIFRRMPTADAEDLHESE